MEMPKSMMNTEITQTFLAHNEKALNHLLSDARYSISDAGWNLLLAYGWHFSDITIQLCEKNSVLNET